MESYPKKTVIYTDGSCRPNPGPGGYGFIILDRNTNGGPIEWHISGGEDNSTNNRMELTAVIEALKFAYDKKDIKMYSDSMYVINCAQGKWLRKKNIDLWREYNYVSNGKNIEWIWVKAHNGNKYNELVDNLAKKEVNSNKK